MMGLLLFHGGEVLELFTRVRGGGGGDGAGGGGAVASCPRRVWDAYVERIPPLTDAQDVFLEVLHQWWSRETSRLEASAHALTRAGLDFDGQQGALRDLEAARAGWLLAKVAGALIAQLSVMTAAQVVATVACVEPYWPTLTGVLGAHHRRRERLRAVLQRRQPTAAAGGGGVGAGAGAGVAGPSGRV